MAIRDNIEEVVQGLIDFGTVTASSLTSDIKQVVVTILGIEDDDGNEQRTTQTLYGNAAVLVRPAATEEDADGNTIGMEVVFVRSGDEMIPVAHRETRWQVDLDDEGEVVVRALAENGARIRLKPNGDCIIESTTAIKLGSDSADEGIPLGDSLKSYLDGHAHGYIDTVGAGSLPTPKLTTAPALGPPTMAGLLIPGTEDTSPDPSSVSKVE